MTSNEVKAKALIRQEIFKALDAMQRHYEKYCNDFNTKAVSIVYIQESTKIFKIEFIKGLNSDKEKTE